MEKYIVAYQNSYEGGHEKFDSYNEAVKYYNDRKELRIDSSIVLAKIIEQYE